MLLLEQIPELSRRLGISLGHVNYCLQALAAKGWLKVENLRQSPHKQSYIYALTPTGIATKSEMMGRFLKSKIAEFDRLKTRIARLERELPDQGNDTR